MRIKVLTENTASSPLFGCEHGLSLYIETDAGVKILFDMGQTDIFAENAKKLSVDLSLVDIAVLSHGHYDHGGGLLKFLDINSSSPIYVSRRAFGEYYNADGKYIGLDPSILDNGRIVLTDNNICLQDGIELLVGENFQPIEPITSYGLLEKINGLTFPDPFIHEQYLLIEENGKRILFSGCSHRGIFNIMQWCSPDVFVGGLHFMKLDADTDEGRSVLEGYAQRLLKYPCSYYTCHCTGVAQYEFLKKIMNNKINYISAGAELQI